MTPEKEKELREMAAMHGSLIVSDIENRNGMDLSQYDSEIVDEMREAWSAIIFCALLTLQSKHDEEKQFYIKQANDTATVLAERRKECEQLTQSLKLAVQAIADEISFQRMTEVANQIRSTHPEIQWDKKEEI